MTDERILELRKCGYTLREIGNEFGVSYQAIQYRLKGIHERLEEEKIRSEFEKVQKRNHPIYKIKKKYQKEAEQLRTELELKNEEIERLKDERAKLKFHLMAMDSAANLYKKNHDVLEEALRFQKLKNETIKSEARKEFAERLKGEICDSFGFVKHGKRDIDIDNLLKEMESD